MKRFAVCVGLVLAIAPLSVLLAVPRVQLHKPPPGQVQVEDLWWVNIFNPDGKTYDPVWLHGEVYEATHGLVYRANTNEFTLPPGRTTKRLGDVRLLDQWHQQGYEAFFLRTGSLPEGEYRYVITLLPFRVSDEDSLRVEHPGPPRLVLPRDDDTLQDAHPMFTWTPPVPRPRAPLAYELHVMKMLRGQTPGEAAAANPPWFRRAGIATTALRYPTSGRPFEPGGRYAWQVKATAGRLPVEPSEVRSFWFRAEPAETAAGLPYSWDVETRRTLDYRLTVSETEGRDTVAVFSSDVELRFTGNGEVRITFSGLGGHARTDPDAASRTSRQDAAPGPHHRVNQQTGRAGEAPPGAPISCDYTMLPSGKLLGDDPAAMFLSHYSFEVLPEESVSAGDTWVRLHSRLVTTPPMVQRDGSDTLDLRLVFRAVTLNSESVAVSLTGSLLLPASESAMEWRELLSGVALFDPVDRCTERSDYAFVIPGVDAGTPRKLNVSVERQRSRE